MEEFADVGEPKVRKALDNTIKDARLKMTDRTEIAINVDAEKVRRRAMGHGVLDQTGRKRFIRENRPAIEKRRQALKTADPTKYNIPGGAGGAFQAAAAQLLYPFDTDEDGEEGKLANDSIHSLHPGTRPPNPGSAAVNGARKPQLPASLKFRSSTHQTTNKSSNRVSSAEAGSLARGSSDAAVKTHLMWLT
ncbi:hypothetical protein FISHEDRAFT_75694 [Fistulina hepatica ATCC 64428]|uniref:Uncharacterized protein n=1 Tax=Fistulina hepatica ATCC 64428 TaxID=1128425 RepID=A0A0D7A5U1_9AGAR|nr:hypothetical protein FISHEDRAFT_75694 [Fistulina hepatica ATCC 64428]